MRRRRRAPARAAIADPTVAELVDLVDAVAESYRREAVSERDRARQHDLLIAAAAARGIAAAMRRR